MVIATMTGLAGNLKNGISKMPYKYLSTPSIKFIKKETDIEQSENPFASGYKKKRGDDYYPPEFYKIRPRIIAKFNDRCFICNQLGYEIHHIDYDKMNSDESNFVLLCKSCHSKTNSGREYWKFFFEEKLLEYRYKKSDEEEQ